MGFWGQEDQDSHLVQRILLFLARQDVLCHLGVTCQRNSPGLFCSRWVCHPGALCGSHNNKAHDFTECSWAGPSLVAENVNGKGWKPLARWACSHLSRSPAALAQVCQSSSSNGTVGQDGCKTEEQRVFKS